MSTTAEILEKKLDNVLYGEPWYGTPIYEIIENVSFEAAFERPGKSVHTIAEIVLHMFSWTEEVLDRLNGKPAGLPVSGDWPPPGTPDEETWKLWVADLKLVNVNLVKAIRNLSADQWDEPTNDERGGEPVTTHAELVDGFIQHQIYHAGQIAILAKIING